MPIRIGFIGTGGIAGTHFNTLSQIESAQLVAFCDVSRPRAEAAARRFEGNAFTKPEKMLESAQLDAVYVCLPPHAHQNAELLAVRAGCALFVEKPLANNLKIAETIASAIEDAGVLNSVGYHFRYHEATDRLLKLLAPKSAPKPSLLYGRWLGGFPGVPWWRDLKKSGGQMNEQATHIVDLARYIVGDIEKIYCASALREMDKEFPNATTPDVTTLTAHFQNGAIGTFSCAALLGSMNEVGLRLMAKETIYDLDGNNLSQRQKGETHTFSGSNNAYLDEDKAFIEAVSTGKRAGIRSTYADSLKSLRVTLAANQSARLGRAVRV